MCQLKRCKFPSSSALRTPAAAAHVTTLEQLLADFERDVNEWST